MFFVANSCHTPRCRNQAGWGRELLQQTVSGVMQYAVVLHRPLKYFVVQLNHFFTSLFHDMPSCLRVVIRSFSSTLTEISCRKWPAVRLVCCLLSPFEAESNLNLFKCCWLSGNILYNSLLILEGYISSLAGAVTEIQTHWINIVYFVWRKVAQWGWARLCWKDILMPNSNGSTFWENMLIHLLAETWKDG